MENLMDSKQDERRKAILGRAVAEVRSSVEGAAFADITPFAFGGHPATSFEEFLAIRLKLNDWTWVGLSSDELVAEALGPKLTERASQWATLGGNGPRDYEDLDRCEQTYRLLPEHQRNLVFPTLETFRGIVQERYGVRKHPVHPLSPGVAAAFGVAA